MDFYGGIRPTASNNNTGSITYESIMEQIYRAKRAIDSRTPTGAAATFGGVPIFESPYAVQTKQYRFPKKRKNRRWVKKFRKKYTKKVPCAFVVDDDYFPFGSRGKKIVAHPAYVTAIKAKLL